MVVKDKGGIPIPIFWPVNANVILFFFANHSPSFSVDVSEWCIFSSLENAIENVRRSSIVDGK